MSTNFDLLCAGFDMRTKAEFLFEPFWIGTDPFYGGKAAVPAYQMSLYYTCATAGGNVHRHVNFSKAGADELASLYEACRPPAEVGSDDPHCKARKLDLGAFATLFDPRSVGILERVSRGLPYVPEIAAMELKRFNMYGERIVSESAWQRDLKKLVDTAEGDFFKPHKDLPENALESWVGSLVVVLPTRHKGGQIVLRHNAKEWTLDFADTFGAATDPLVCFAGCFADAMYEVLPVASGHCVTLTYDLYLGPSNPSTSCIPTPSHRRFKKVLFELINDKSTLPDGGYLACGLMHEYVYSPGKSTDLLEYQLKGVDRMLTMICEEHGLEYRLMVLYHNLCDSNVNLATRSALRTTQDGKWQESYFLEEALEEVTDEDIGGVEIVGHQFHRHQLENEELSFLLPFYKDPTPRILEIRPISSVMIATPWASDREEGNLEHVNGHMCVLVTIAPVATRKELVL